MTEPEAAAGSVQQDPVVAELAQADAAVDAAVDALNKALAKQRWTGQRDEDAVNHAKDVLREADEARREVAQKRNEMMVKDAHPPLLAGNAQLGRRYGLSERQVGRILKAAPYPPPQHGRDNRRAE